MTAAEILGFIFLIFIIFILLAGCLFVWTTKPGAWRPFEIPAAYCHRGLHNKAEAPENSLEAFRRAKEKGLGAELDVHLTLDGDLCVIHDSDLKRLTGTEGKVEEMTMKDLSKLHILGSHETIPSFKDVLSVCENIPILCEIKTVNTDTFEEVCKKTYEMIKEYKGPVVIESFNPYALHWFRENAPEIIRGQLSQPLSTFKKYGMSGFEFFLASNLMYNFLSKPDFVAYDIKGSSLGLSLNRIFGTRLVGWTCESINDVQNAANEGYSSFICQGFDITEV